MNTEPSCTQEFKKARIAYTSTQKSVPKEIRQKYRKYKNALVYFRPADILIPHHEEYVYLYNLMNTRAKEMGMNENNAGDVYLFIMSIRSELIKNPLLSHYRTRLKPFNHIHNSIRNILSSYKLCT